MGWGVPVLHVSSGNSEEHSVTVCEVCACVFPVKSWCSTSFCLLLFFGNKHPAAVSIQSHYGDYLGRRAFSFAVIDASRIWMLIVRSSKWQKHFLRVVVLCCNCNVFRDFRSRVSRLCVHGCNRVCVFVCERERERERASVCVLTQDACMQKKSFFFFCQSLG